MERVVGDGCEGDRVRSELVGRVLPGAVDGDASLFGAGVAELDRLNGEWYADEQGGVYHEASAPLVERLASHDDAKGAGQSSWGPSVYALTTAEKAEAVADAVDTTAYVARPSKSGASVSLLP
jgi:beta-ribofuranosylaminobenzene 5'-phosphate synthase